MSGIWDYFFKDPAVELYEFHCGADFYRYCATSQKDYEWNGKVFKAEAVTRSALHFSSDFARDVLTVTIPADAGLAQIFFSGTPDFLMRLTVYRGSRHSASFQPIWIGLVTGASFSFDGTSYSCELNCETAASRMERLGLARNYQLTCPHTLYGNMCGVKQSRFASIRTVTDISGFRVTVSGDAIADGYYTAGQAVAASGARRFIASSAGNIITIEREMGLRPGDVLTLYPGCDKARSTCINKFGNGAAYGGFPWLPVTNPYTSVIG